MKSLTNCLSLFLFYLSIISADTYGAFLSIIEQPTNRIRYRYRSEKGSHGGLNGENSSQLKKTYPTIKVSATVGCPLLRIDQLLWSVTNSHTHAHRWKTTVSHRPSTFAPVWRPMKASQSLTCTSSWDVTAARMAPVPCQWLKT